MATTTEPHVTDGKHHYVEFDEYVDFHLGKTRSGIKYTEILTTLGWMATLGLSYLLAFTVFDHWVIEGGFSPVARFWLLIGAVGVTVGWLGWRVVYPYLRRINVLYAARQIEQAAPGLKGGLLNLVDLQHAGKKIPDHVRVAIEKRAAVELSQIDVEQAVDHRPLMRVSYLLLFIVTVCCLYKLFSPKDILASAKRAMLPTSNTAPPTQTRIKDVEPGHVSVVARSSVPVRAKISGREPEAVTLYFSTLDGKYVDEPILMKREEEGLQTFAAVLAGENARGLLQDVTYRIEAGDAATEDFRISVVQPPSARVESVAYEFPDYMQLENRTENTGHINGWQGTQVTLRAMTNIPVKSAKVVLVEEDRPTGEEYTMQVTEGEQLSANWKLEIRSDGTFAPHYWIQCQTEDGRTDPNPTRYDIVIKPDLPPKVAMLAPQSDLKIPANGTIPIRYQAADPDFRLRSLKLIVAKDGDEIVEKPLIEEEGLRQAVRGSFDWKLEPLKLSVGERLQFWLEAKDNRTPRANTKATHRLNVEIVEAVSEEEAQEQLRQEKQKQEEQAQEAADQQQENQDQPDEGDQGDDRDEEGETKGGEPGKQEGEEGKTTDPSKKKPGEGEQGDDAGKTPGENQQPSDKPDAGGDQSQQERLDPENKDDQEQALKEIMERQREQQEKQEAADEGKPEPKQKEGESQDKPAPEEQKPGEGESGKQPDEKQPDQKKQDGGKPGENQGAKGSESKPGEENKPGDKGSKNKGTPGDGGKEPAPGKEPGAGDQPSEEQPNPDEPGKKDKAEDKDQNTEGKETPAADDPDAEKKPATGEEEGIGKAGDDKDAAKAKKQLDREGEKNDAGRKPGDPNDKPQAKEKGDPNDPNKPSAKPKPGETDKDQSDKKPGEQKDQAGDKGKSKPEDQPEGSQKPPKGEGKEDQKSPKPADGEKGKSSENKEGKEGGKEPGEGEESQEPGGEKSDQESKGKPGDKPSGKPEEGSPAEPSEQASDEEGPSKQSGGGKGSGSEGSGGEPQSSGKSGGGGAPAPNEDGEEVAGGPGQDEAGDGKKKKGKGTGQAASTPDAEKANLDHAKKATNLVLDRLKDQLERGEVDQELLERLGWTEDDLRKFTDRMQKQLKDTGKDVSPAAVARRRQFEEMIKDIHTAAPTRRQGSEKPRQKRVNQFDTKGRPPVPQRFRSRYREYTRSFSGSKKSRTRGKPAQKK